MLKEIIANEAQITERDSKMRKFERVATQLKNNSQFNPIIDGHIVLMKLKRG